MGSLKSLGRGYAKEIVERISQRSKLRNIEEKNPILIYQMGKVGSSTVVRTLEKLSLDTPILQIHTLSPNHLAHAIRRQRSSISPYLRRHLIISSILIKKFKEKIFPCRVITITREPVSRAISFVFEDLIKQAPEAILPDGRLDAPLIKDAINRILTGQNGIANPTLWFDKELLECLGIDVLAQPFEPEKGFAILENGPLSVLVIRMEDLDKTLAKALAAFLEIDPSSIEIQRANIGAQKKYASTLKHIKDTYRVPPGPARQIFHTRYFRHFYRDEMDNYVARWT